MSALRDVQAQLRAACRGHRHNMPAFKRIPGSVWEEIYATACTRCGRKAVVTVTRATHTIAVHGTAQAIDCPKQRPRVKE